MPRTALNTRMRLITLVDGAKNMIMIVTYCGFRVKDGGWSNQQLIGRSALANGTIPRNELQALNGGSNLSWIIRKGLSDWVESSILASDSEIALKWTTFDSRKLGMWVRNRIIQIRRGTELNDLYYVGTEHNICFEIVWRKDTCFKIVWGYKFLETINFFVTKTSSYSRRYFYKVIILSSGTLVLTFQALSNFAAS